MFSTYLLRLPSSLESLSERVCVYLSRWMMMSERKKKREVLTHPLSSPPDTAAQLPTEGLVRSSQHTCLLHLCYVHRLTLCCGRSSLAILRRTRGACTVDPIYLQHSALSGQVLRLQYQKELAQSHVTVQTKFNYAWGLVKSPVREHQVEGVRLLQGVWKPFAGLAFAGG